MDATKLDQLRKLNIGMLRVLMAILRDGNISHAAAEVGITQPAASNALARLRTIFDDPLLVREQSRAVLTPHGEMLLRRLQDLIPRIDALAALPVFDPETALDRFRIAVTDHANLLLIPIIVREVRRQAPGVQLSIVTCQNHQIDSELDDSVADLRLGWMRSLPPNWFLAKLMVDDMVAIQARQAHPPTSVSLVELSQRDHTAIDVPGGHSNSIIGRFFRENGYERKVAALVTNYGTIPYIVAQSDLVAILPRQLAMKFADVVDVLPIDGKVGAIEFNLSISWPPHLNADQAHKWLRNLIKGCMQQLAGQPELH